MSRRIPILPATLLLALSLSSAGLAIGQQRLRSEVRESAWRRYDCLETSGKSWNVLTRSKSTIDGGFLHSFEGS